MPFYESRDRTLEVSTVENFSYPLHLHREIEIIFGTGGRLCVFVDGQKYLLREGDAVIAFPNVVHGYQEIAESGKGLFLTFPAEISQDYGAQISKSRPANPYIPKESVHSDVPVLLEMILRESTVGRDISALKAIMALVVARLMPCINLEDSVKIASTDKLYQMLSYLAEHCTDPLTLEDLSAEFDLSVSYISHMFSDTMHINFRSYLNALRLRKALTMLWSTDEPVTRICYDCGFESQRTFNRAFREHFGITPTEYRAGQGMYPSYHAAEMDALPAVQAEPTIRAQI